MTRPPLLTSWRPVVRPCLINCVRAYKASRVLAKHRLYPEAGSELHRMLESLMEAAIAFKNIPVLSSTHSGMGTHKEKREKFRAHWLGHRSPFSQQELSDISTMMSLFAAAEREDLMYVRYVEAKPPELKKKQYERLLRYARRAFRIVRPHLNPIP